MGWRRGKGAFHVGGVVLVGLAAGGCQTGDASPKVTENHVMLSCTPRLEGNRLVLSLELENRFKTPIWVAKGLPVPSGPTLEVSPTAAYVRPRGEEVLITREYLTVPDHIDVEAPERPEWARIEPGGTYLGVLEVPWPLAPRDPYERLELPPSGTERKIWCGLGYVPVTGDTPPRDPAHQERWLVELDEDRLVSEAH